MKKISEPARDIDVLIETDVLVVGSGPGGLAAALAASRAGALTVLLERNGCFGGNITQVGGEGFAWYRHEQTVDCEGIGIEFEERAKTMGAAMPEPQSLSHALDAEMFKYVADVLVQEAGITPMLHRLCVSPILEGRTSAATRPRTPRSATWCAAPSAARARESLRQFRPAPGRRWIASISAWCSRNSNGKAPGCSDRARPALGASQDALDRARLAEHRHRGQLLYL